MPGSLQTSMEFVLSLSLTSLLLTHQYPPKSACLQAAAAGCCLHVHVCWQPAVRPADARSAELQLLPAQAAMQLHGLTQCVAQQLSSQCGLQVLWTLLSALAPAPFEQCQAQLQLTPASDQLVHAA